VSKTAASGHQPRIRLDQLIVDRGLAGSRTMAQALVLAGKVRVGAGDGARRDRKPGDLLDPAEPVSVTPAAQFASRGGHKLAAALEAFGLDPSGLVCLDVGASTGGFTDVLLKGGAARVHAVDVGRGQLADVLARDPRVVVHDRTNARDLTAETLGELVDLAVIDVSFISLSLVLGPVAGTLGANGHVIALVKPQFEAERGQTQRGVVRDPAIHREVLARVVAAASKSGLGARDTVASPILGPAGNREFLVHLAPGPSCSDIGERIALAASP
jgi:23S rRNA (cytidine1920-2'-O)/16S rRNA (cytidine1409-2'-O)-methyltransferase